MDEQASVGLRRKQKYTKACKLPQIIHLIINAVAGQNALCSLQCMHMIHFRRRTDVHCHKLSHIRSSSLPLHTVIISQNTDAILLSRTLIIPHTARPLSQLASATTCLRITQVLPVLFLLTVTTASTLFVMCWTGWLGQPLAPTPTPTPAPASAPTPACGLPRRQLCKTLRC